jgi:NAD(P)-dependent dehydrogenase (short-subunit alcohol dehydrogenase family)
VSPTGVPQTIDDTADQVTARGGEGIPVRCDHADAREVGRLFERIAADHGRLDILVSNAWGGYELSVDRVPFWELPIRHLDLMVEAGLRSRPLTVQRAWPLLRRARGVLVAITSAPIGEPFHGHLYYDVIKTAINRDAGGAPR